MGVCNCSMLCCTLPYAHSSFAIIWMEKRELVALLSQSSWCVVIVVWLFLAVPLVCLQFVIVLFSWSYSLTIPLDYFTRLCSCPKVCQEVKIEDMLLFFFIYRIVLVWRACTISDWLSLCDFELVTQIIFSFKQRNSPKKVVSYRPSRLLQFFANIFNKSKYRDLQSGPRSDYCSSLFRVYAVWWKGLEDISADDKGIQLLL